MFTVCEIVELREYLLYFVEIYITEIEILLFLSDMSYDFLSILK